MKLYFSIIATLVLAFSSTANATDWTSFERSVNSIYECGKITDGMATQWTEHQRGIVVKCSNNLRYLILKAGEGRVAIRPILSDPFVKASTQHQEQINRLREAAQAKIQ